MAPLIYRQSLYTSDVLVLQDWIPGPDRYHRDELHVCITADGPKGWTSDNVAVGGIGDVLDFPAYDLLYFPCDRDTGVPAAAGSPVGRITRSAAGSEKSGTLAVNFGALPDGVGFARFQPLDASGAAVPLNVVPSESYPMTPLTLDRHGQAKDFPWYVSAYSDWEWHDDGAVATHFYGVRSATLDVPQQHPQPLDTRDWLPFKQSDWPKLFTLNHLPPMGQGIDYMPRRTLRGNITTADIQAYFTYDLTCLQPRRSFTNGEFGEAIASHILDFHKGRLNKPYFMVPHSWRVSDSTRRQRTILGFYHVEPVYYADVMALNAAKVPTPHPALRSWGIWPAAWPWWAQCPHLSWGAFFVDSTVVQGTGAPVQDVTMHSAEAPHDGIGPQARVLHGYGGNVLRAQYAPNDHTIMPTVTVAATMEGAPPITTPGASKTDQIDIQDLHDGTYAVSERSKHRISRWRISLDPNVPDAFVEYLCQLPAGVAVSGTVVDHQYICTSHTLVAAQAVDGIIAPEGIDKVKGDPWLYVGSSVQGQYVRVHVDTKERQLVCPERDGRQSQTLLYQCNVSDGTTGPFGALWHVDFDNQSSGPRVHMPTPGLGTDGRTYTHNTWATFEKVSYNQAVGVGPQLNGTYPLAVYAKNSCIMLGGTEQMLRVWRMPMPGDSPQPDAARQARGQAIWNRNGFGLEWSPHTYGASSKRIPVNDPVIDPAGDMAYWLAEGMGHSELSPEDPAVIAQLQADLAAAQAANATLAKSVQAAQDANTALQTQVTQLTADLATMTGKFNKLNTDIDAAQAADK